VEAVSCAEFQNGLTSGISSGWEFGVAGIEGLIIPKQKGGVYISVAYGVFVLEWKTRLAEFSILHLVFPFCVSAEDNVRLLYSVSVVQ
jgi:hypothetical protein